MKEKTFKQSHMLGLIMMSVAIIVCISLCMELYFFRSYVRELAVLKEEYVGYRQCLRRMIAEQQRREYDVAAVPGTSSVSAKKKS